MGTPVAYIHTEIIDLKFQKYGDQVNAMIESRAAKVVERANEAGRRFLEEAKKTEGAKITANGVVYIQTKKGFGPYPSSGSSVKVHYTGMLAE